jgi:hypothetical protein
MGTMNIAIVPARTESFIVIAVEMSEEVVKGILGKRFAEIKIIDHDIGICYETRHTLLLFDQ